MKKDLLQKHIKSYKRWMSSNKDEYRQDSLERLDRITVYRSWSRERLLEITRDELLEYLGSLWAMQIWGNKAYVIDRAIEACGLDGLRQELAELIWGGGDIAQRWDRARVAIKGFGPATMSELLCYVYPDEYMIWNRRVRTGYKYLGVPGLPVYDYQLKGAKYVDLCNVAKTIRSELTSAGLDNVNLLYVDYFIWQELQIESETAQPDGDTGDVVEENAFEKASSEDAEFIHNEVRDKLANIGTWLGFLGNTEVKVSEGSVVDATWEVTIGNMGRVIYVFEVQAKGALDSLMVNLLTASEHPAVQGIVAVSDSKQIEKIKRRAAGMRQLKDTLKCWDYREVLRIHQALEQVNEAVNRLGLVPTGF